jgi:hypothetical protein
MEVEKVFGKSLQTIELLFRILWLQKTGPRAQPVPLEIGGDGGRTFYLSVFI